MFCTLVRCLNNEICKDTPEIKNEIFGKEAIEEEEEDENENFINVNTSIHKG